jgi:hypothetical protein
VDRLIFDRLRHEPHGCTGQATVYYALDPKDGLHATLTPSPKRSPCGNAPGASSLVCPLSAPHDS